MKVVLLMQDTRALYGAEQATLRLAAGLAGAGVEARVLLMREARMGGGDSPLAAEFGRVAPTEEITVRGRFSREAIGAIRGCMARTGADVLHSTGYKADCHAAWAGDGGRRFPVVGTVHGWLFRRDPKEWLFRELNVRALRRFTRVVALSGFYEEYLRRRGLHATQLARIPTGVDADGIVGAEQAGQLWADERRPFVFGMLGRLSEEKNHALMLAAARRVARNLDRSPRPWRILVAGDGPLRGKLEAMAARMGLADRTTWAGWMDSADFFGQVHALVQCSRVENQPMSVMEAMAWTRPTLATRAGGLPELVEDGSTGWLAANGDARALAAAMETCLAAPEKARAAGERGRERLERNYSFRRMVDEHVGMYSTLASPAGATWRGWRPGGRRPR